MKDRQPFDIARLARQASQATPQVAQLSTEQKNTLLQAMADNIRQQQKMLLNENNKDIEAGRAKGLTDAMLDRLLLTEARIEGIASAIEDIIHLDDPVGRLGDFSERPNGIKVGKMRIPLGVIAMIYEARPNVTAEAAALCLKSGNGVILRGGSEAVYSNRAIATLWHQVLADTGLETAIITIVPNTDRSVISELLKLNEDIDLVIPRGGEALIRYVTDNSRIPVIQHYKGVCHLYIDEAADIEKAVAILVNGKTQRPSACNAIETLVVHRELAGSFLPKAAEALAEFDVTIHACPKSREFFADAQLATDDDYHAEYLAQEIAVKVVDNYEAAIEHIQTYTSDHTEVIVTEDELRGHDFIRRINSSVVMVNASSRFSDGGELGLGSEIGISTSKLHAFGPMGLEALTTEKFVVLGDGQVRK
ncbi:glutamate-5-semialdehyde dehydrogenase [Parashewanella curva]|uniref:Gamma-glutamyl phosphate reductase n=2 Tax=Parashewanella curva TaxID=2338552 RepID=A0A3L8PZU5_9GAMM|nr:glutamate-5-semialdehyde dehydrogenase [Parashewanella curva]